ncbi:MAG: BamA/TamA family outer membrane protein, partial [Armatimonadetes bacterium]|nr:BamA/TamA family outer membrane protein [Armatimonadota bacterium]
GRVDIVGNTKISTETLKKELAWLQPGKVFNVNTDNLDRDFGRLIKKYEEAGYQSFPERGAETQGVRLLTPEADGSVTVTISIVEVRVNELKFTWGTQKPKTKERVLRAYMKTRPGDVLNWRVIGQDLAEIRRLDILEDIKVSDKFLPNDPTKEDLTYEVTEKKTGNIGAGGGLSSRYGLVGFVDVSESNLFGLAHRIESRVEFGGRFNFNTTYFYPLLDGHGTELEFRVYNTEDRTGATGIGAFTNRRANFDQVRRGGSILYSRPIAGQLRGSVQYQIENVSTARRGSQLPNLPPFPFQDIGSDTTSSLTFGLTHDTRDYPFDSTRGMFQSGSLEWAFLGGDNRFIKYHLETRHYWPVLGGTVKSGRRERPAWVVATRARAGFSSGRLPFSQSFFIGGSESLRGFTEDRFFGNREFLFNLELRRSFPYNLMLAAFFDAGRAWRQGEPFRFFDDMASSVGVSLRVSTPVGPLRFDVGFGGEGTKTHLSFGQPF